MQFLFEVFHVAVIQMMCLNIGRLRTHEVGKLEGYGLVVTLPSGGLQL